MKDHLKLQNAKRSEFIYEVETFNKKCAIRKWLRRKNATKLAKLRVRKLNAAYNNQRLRTYFNALKTQYTKSRNLCYRLANLANVHD